MVYVLGLGIATVWTRVRKRSVRTGVADQCAVAL